MDYKLSVGYNGKFEALEKIINASEKVKNVYTGGVRNKISGGRYQYANTLDELKNQINYAHDHGVNYSVTLNGPCGVHKQSDTLWWNDVRDYLLSIEDAGADNVIISHPFVMELAKKETHMCVMASTICEVTNTRSALYYQSFGADVLCPSVSINYDLEALRSIKKALKGKTSLKLLVNEYCLGNCPYRRFHQAHLSHANEPGYDIDYPMHCTRVYKENPYLYLTNNAIRPEDLKNYEDISDEFKLIGRTTNSDDLVTMVKGYSDGHYEGNLLDLIDKASSQNFYIDNKKLDGIFEKKTQCKFECSECDYCKELYKKVGE